MVGSLKQGGKCLQLSRLRGHLGSHLTTATEGCTRVQVDNACARACLLNLQKREHSTDQRHVRLTMPYTAQRAELTVFMKHPGGYREAEDFLEITSPKVLRGAA